VKARGLRFTIVSSAAVALGLLSACHQAQTENGAPGSSTPSGPSPSVILKNYKIHSPPPLNSAADVPKFLDWAGASHVDEEEDGRKAIAAAAGNKEVVDALIKEVERVQTSDHSRALLALSALGETRSPEAQEYFAAFVQRPLPMKGTVIEGEIVEQTRAAQLQAKAVDGLAYSNTENSNRIITQIIAEHPSKIVRAEAINAYLWNHGDSDEARKLLSQYVRKDELILLDRVRRNSGETAESFNRKLALFLKQHPEVVPPRPEKLEPTQRAAGQRKAFDGKPPAF
jgi:hypothetical protein